MANKNELEEAIEALKQQRDSLEMKMHLAAMEAKDEYERLSGNIDELTKQMEPLQEVVEETAGNVFAALMLAADEMKAGFKRVQNAVDKQD